MFYLSILIILLGVLILIYSVFLDARSRRTGPAETPRPAGPLYPADQGGAGTRPRTAAAAPIQSPATAAAGDRPGAFSARPVDLPASPVQAVSSPRESRPWPREQGAAAESGMSPAALGAIMDEPAPYAAPAPEPAAILYEDSAPVADYGTVGGIIDATLQRYRDIRRIGRGILAPERDGLSFHQGKKLYRYDFRSLRDLKTGPGFVAAYLRGGGPARLFVLENAPGLAEAVDAAFTEYQRKANSHV